eukprot:112575-Chlamydomonas_euryale.AAC.5
MAPRMARPSHTNRTVRACAGHSCVNGAARRALMEPRGGRRKSPHLMEAYSAEEALCQADGSDSRTFSNGFGRQKTPAADACMRRRLAQQREAAARGFERQQPLEALHGRRAREAR